MPNAEADIPPRGPRERGDAGTTQDGKPWWVVIDHLNLSWDSTKGERGQWVPSEKDVPSIYVGPYATEKQAAWAVQDAPSVDGYCCDTKNPRHIDDVTYRQGDLPEGVEHWPADLDGYEEDWDVMPLGEPCVCGRRRPVGGQCVCGCVAHPNPPVEEA